MIQIQFGTDGWRAVIAEDFTFANVARVAQATADFWQSEIRNPKSEIYRRELKAVVGYDRRFLSDRFAQITAEVFAGNDFQVILTPEPTPTPSVSFAVKNLGAVGGDHGAGRGDDREHHWVLERRNLVGGGRDDQQLSGGVCG